MEPEAEGGYYAAQGDNQKKKGQKMTDEQKQTFDQALCIMQCIANSAACGNAYSQSWNNDFRCNDIDGIFNKVKSDADFGKEAFWRKVFSLPDEQKRALGFRHWDAGEAKMCIPIWIWQCLPDDMEFDGEKKKDLDDDVRFGCVWWRA